MSNVKSISVTRARTINLGNYSSERLEITEVIELDEGDDPKEVRTKSLNRLRKALEAEVERSQEEYFDDGKK